MRLPPLSLYVHLPWCERKCPYCDFNSFEVAALPQAQYLACLLRDLETDAARVSGREVQTIFIGGGTPSLFSGDAIAELLDGIRSRVPLATNVEITMEANPGSAEAGRFAAYRDAGVTRLSLGVQSFNDDALRQLGRVHSAEDALRAIQHIHDAGFSTFNIDLMHGLPGQSTETAAGDLRQAIAAGAPHVSWYQLTIEPNTVFYSDPPLLPVDDRLADIQTHGEGQLAAAGLDQYEVSAYAKPGEQCRHNRNYWQFGDYLAVGAGAHGKISDGEGGVVRYRKTRAPSDYMAATDDMFTCATSHLSVQDKVGEFAMNALRLTEGFSLSLFTERTDLPPSELDAPVASLRNRGLLEKAGDHIVPTALGRRFLDSVIAEFFAGPP